MFKLGLIPKEFVGLKSDKLLGASPDPSHLAGRNDPQSTRAGCLTNDRHPEGDGVTAGEIVDIAAQPRPQGVPEAGE